MPCVSLLSATRGGNTHQGPARRRKGDEALEEAPALGKVGVGLVLQLGRRRAAIVQMHGGGDGGNVAEEGIRQGHLLVQHHVNHAHDPRRVYEGQLRRPPPKGVGDGQVRVVLRAHDVEERVVEDGRDGVVRKLLLQPRRPVVAVHLDVLHLAFVKLDRVVPVAHGDPVLGLHKVGQDRGIHGVAPPGLAEDAVRAVRHVLAHAAPDPAEMDACIPDARLARDRVAEIVERQGGHFGVQLHVMAMLDAARAVRLAPYLCRRAEDSRLAAVVLVQDLQTPKDSLLALRREVVHGVSRVQVQHGRSAQLQGQAEVKLAEMHVSVCTTCD